MSSLSAVEGFTCGGLAGCAAVTFSNSAEVAKTRLQLQGELSKRGGVKVYQNVFDALLKTWRNEGIRGLQRGIGAAYFYQVALNGCYIGFYEPIRRSINSALDIEPSRQVAATTLLAGSLSAVSGAFFSSPLFLVKARMQAYSPVLPIGTQRYYKHAAHALSTIVLEEGPKGLMRGADAAMLRAAFAGMVQVPSYIWAKGLLVRHGLGDPDSAATFVLSSALSGALVCLAMQPADTALTRVYNQPTMVMPDGRLVGKLYKNPLDCMWKTLKIEGLHGWYKGATAQFCFLLPQTIILLTANDIIVRLYLQARDRPL
ncbi:oxaloacetate carrier [Wolfiporia cocos MD-104 SS10]|uniref:Oxaloacetate carrier n=1 Tax=Wolfiporia cocos (strain MD-104) TaxID=742152 RepID=A0A2H3J9X8_WOLCO|nr:oxaloacetate carrier [Wolfiporia cocos MD-104 SS10]